MLAVALAVLGSLAESLSIQDRGSVTANSWVGIATAVKGAGGCALEIKLTLPFTSDYSSQITIPSNTNITIRGNGAVLDASQKGRFFNVTNDASLTLHSLTLQNGSAPQNGSCLDVSAGGVASQDCVSRSPNRVSRLRVGLSISPSAATQQCTTRRSPMVKLLSAQYVKPKPHPDIYSAFV
jgi:hypothetical protein